MHHNRSAYTFVICAHQHNLQNVLGGKKKKIFWKVLGKKIDVMGLEEVFREVSLGDSLLYKKFR